MVDMYVEQGLVILNEQMMTEVLKLSFVQGPARS